MEDIEKIINQKFPGIKDPDLRKEIAAKGKLTDVKAGTVLMNIGSYIKTIPLVINGSVKVLREDEKGNEVFLYFLQAGEGCAMTLNCCMTNKPSEVKVVADEDVQLITIPVEVMDKWLRKYPEWNNFIIQTYSDRFQELMNTIDSIAFQQLDVRLLNYLNDKAAASRKNIVNTTHQKIAYDLNSSREVVSRLLKQLEKTGKIHLGRNKIELK